MLERVTTSAGLVFYQSPLLAARPSTAGNSGSSGGGIPHAFTTRIGGVSPPPFDSFNFQPASRSVAHLGPGPAIIIRGSALSPLAASHSPTPPSQALAPTLAPPPPLPPAHSPNPTPAPLPSSAPPATEYESVIENFRRVAAALDRPHHRTICIWQVHGDNVCHWPDEANDATPDDPTTVVAQADALITADPNVLIAVRVADCVPVLLANREGTAVAAVHAGWRGVAANIIDATLAALRTKFNCDPRDLIAAIGPCISAEHFEVGFEVADAFDKAGLSEAVRREFRPKPHIDLQHALALQLERAGVPRAQIDRNDRCTYRDKDEFYSHRRDEGRTGRMAAVIGVRRLSDSPPS